MLPGIEVSPGGIAVGGVGEILPMLLSDILSRALSLEGILTLSLLSPSHKAHKVE